jgi:uncharacterized protein YjcR
MIKLDLPNKQIAKEYIEGMSVTKLGEKYNCNRVTIWKRLKEDGVKIRETGPPPKASKEELKKRKENFHKFMQENPARKEQFVDLIIECLPQKERCE